MEEWKTMGVLRLALASCLLVALPVPGRAHPPDMPIAEFAALGRGAVCFTTGRGSTAGSDCAALAVHEIDRARREILVQAYSFTEPHIITALIAAANRGVHVMLLVDKSAPRLRGEGVDACARAGIAVAVDDRPRIAHNKVMVIDGTTVLTGSFNWSKSAETANAENLLVIHAPALAAAYAANFTRRLKVSEPYAAAGTD